MKLLLTAALLAMHFLSTAQIPTDKEKALLSSAFQALNGYLQPLDEKRALDLFEQCAALGNPQAMNAIGMQYRQGLGIPADHEKAFLWFKKASQKGYAPALFNLGLMYKYGNGCEQDFQEAYNSFVKAAKMNYPSGIYGAAYMLYKGLGCSQDYVKALDYLKKGADLRSPSCAYLLGLCYRNGYGIDANPELASFWLNLSAKSGYIFSKDELTSNKPENFEDASRLVQATDRMLKLGMPSEYKKISDIVYQEDLIGDFNGYFIRYDYSSKYILSCQPLKISFSNSSGRFSGIWIENEAMPISVIASFSGKGLSFANMTYQKTDHYVPNGVQHISFKNTSLKVLKSNDTTILVGDLVQYVTSSKEPEKPVKIIVRKNDNATGQRSNTASEINKILDVQAFPNPFTDHLQIQIEVRKSAIVSTEVLTADGKKLYSTTPTNLQPGRYIFSPTLNVTPGNYVVSVLANNEQKSLVVIKK
jgi:hypothetical protein